METPGEYLKKEREKENISLEEISRITRINLSSLENIEADKYDSLPVRVITRGYLRSYARALELEEKEVLSLHEEYLGYRKEEGDKNKESMAGKKTYRKHLLLVILLITFACLLFYVYPDFMKREEISSKNTVKTLKQIPAGKIGDSPKKDPPKENREEAPGRMEPEQDLNINTAQIQLEAQETPSEQKVSGKEEQVFKPTEEDVSVPKDPDIFLPERNSGITLTAKVTEMTWINFRIDGGRSQEVLLRSGETFSWKAENKIKLLIGNAGGVDFTLNGENLGYLGASGEVLSITLPR